jgi:serine/threonine protein phosphatase PrpC/predicted  nucleic acid-binding Zn-ribbon protein
MDCIHCGASLRPGARFCNQCGGLQDAQSAEPPPAASPGTSASAATEPAPAEPAAGEPATTRGKRPPRVPRAAIAEEPLVQDEGRPALTEERVHVAEDQDTAASAMGEAGEEPPAAGSATAGDTAPTTGVLDIAAWEEAETAEYRVLAASSPLPAPELPQALPPSMPALDTVVRPPQPAGAGSPGRVQPDGLPWPLPVSIIVDGRYRVEQVLSAMPDTPGAENTYLVRDLRGYERCWSCGEEHDIAAAADQFCPSCGADMLAQPYIMSETRAASARVSPENERADVADAETVATPAPELTPGPMRVFTQGARQYRVMLRNDEVPAFPFGVRLVAAGATDTGAARAGERNEDSLAAFVLNLASEGRTEPLAVCLVADGLGGHADGQEASHIVVRVVTEQLLRAALPVLTAAGPPVPDVEGGLRRALLDALEQANRAICVRNADAGTDMGSTVVAAVIWQDTALVANIGDSRAYLLSDGELRRITTDHSLVEQLIAGGYITPEERYTHPKRNQILRSLGDTLDVQVDLFVQKLRPGMRLVLCSDGLWEMVRDDECAEVLREAVGPQQACDMLVQRANANGGEDNISVIVLDVSA